jgi:hypothetical protein
MLQSQVKLQLISKVYQRHMSKLKIPTLSPADKSDLFDAAVVLPAIDKNMAMPSSSKQNQPDMTPEKELNIRINTIKTLADLNGEDIQPSREHQEQAKELAREMMVNKKLKHEFGEYPNETMAFLAGLVGQTNCMIVEELADLKLFVVNNFVQLVAGAKTDRDKIAALRAIGEIDGVDAFKRKTEITYKMETMEEVETELLSMLKELKAKAVLKPKSQIIDAEIVENARTKTNNN